MKKPTKSMFFDEQPEEKVEVVQEVALSAPDRNILHLPSKGRLGYQDYVEYRDIMVGDEEILSMATNETYSRTLNSVIKGILNNCSFYEQISIYDRDYALVWLWANNYNPVKKVEVTCRHCKNKDQHSIDITKVPVDDVKENIPVPFKMKLKNASISEINLRLNTVQDEMNAEEYMNKHKNSSFEMLMLVSSIDLGVHMSIDSKLKWVRDNVTSAELGTIRNFHKYFKFGVNDVIEHKCTKCEGVTKGPLPFQAEDILYPTVQTDFEELLRTM